MKSRGEYFVHPFFQTASMFLAEGLIIIVYGVQKYRGLVDPLDDKRYYLFGLPAFLDLVSSAITMVGLVLTTASIYQMMRGLIIVFTSLFRRFLLKKRQTR
jgi:drug/metabolite transporter (DMT)-like permease